MKRFIMDAEADGRAARREAGPRPGAPRVAIVGAGPAGLAAAEWLARAGRRGHDPRGAPVRRAAWSAAPSRPTACRRPRSTQDLAVLERLGVELRYGVRVGRDVTVAGLRGDGFGAVFVAVGAQQGKRLGLPGEDADGRARRRRVPAPRARGPPARRRAAGRRGGGRRHGHGLRPLRAPGRGGARPARLPAHHRPDAGRPGGGRGAARGGHRGRRAGPAGRPARGGRAPRRARRPPDGLRRDARRRRPQGPARRAGLGRRAPARHPAARDQPVSRCSTCSGTWRRS